MNKLEAIAFDRRVGFNMDALKPICSACDGDVHSCGPLRSVDDGVTYVGLKHLPKLGQLVDRRSGGRAK